jgi:hypothetical protein
MALMPDDAIPPWVDKVSTLSTYLQSCNMSLPGLQLEAPTESVSAPITHDIKENSEWRFEVPFGSQVNVKVGGDSRWVHAALILVLCDP